MTRITTAAVVAAAVAGMALAGCAPTTEKAAPATGQGTPPTVWTGSPAPAHSDESGHAAPRTEGANLHRYIMDNKIAEEPFTPDQPGTPVVNFPLPADWSPAGERKPDWAYGAIVYDKPKDPDNPPFMYAIASKLTGNVDTEKVLSLAPGQLNELPDFTPIGAPERVKFSGFDAINYVGTYVWDGKTRAVGQQTIVIPGKDALFVLQLNGESPEGQEDVVIDAAKVIRSQTTITAPA